MSELTLLKAKRDENTGIITHEMGDPFSADNQEPEKILYRKIWGGIAWPSEFSPAYACFVGQKHIVDSRFEKDRNKEPLQFLAECQSDALTLDDFFRMVTDESARLCASKMYANLGREWTEEHEQQGEGRYSGYVTSFRRYLSDNEIPYVTLMSAPYVENYLYTVQIINDFKRQERLHVREDSTAFDQLSRIKKSDLQNKPEMFFYAIEALRHVVGAFAKYRPGPSLSGFVPDRNKRLADVRAKELSRGVG